MTQAAPSSCAEAAQARPTGPAPPTYTVLPGLTPAVTAPWNPVGKISERSVSEVIFSFACSLSGNSSQGGVHSFVRPFVHLFVTV